MARPDLRPIRRLPLMESYRGALETCAFCPKLCRSACPVSNAEPRETITPWGKMSTAYFVARGDVPLSASFAAPAWACTGCYACRESCDHRNDVASTLFAARSSLLAAGVAPPSAAGVAVGFARHERATRHAVRELAAHPAVRPDSRTALLVGCAYARALPDEARAAIDAAAALVQGPIALVEACCGLPLLHAGDVRRFERQALTLAEETARRERLLVADAGCAFALRRRYVAAAATISPHVDTLAELAARELGRLGRATVAPVEPVRLHDACQLGRGLGVFEAPRAILTRALGRAPDEFPTHREHAACSGAGALLPRTMRAVAHAIGRARIDEHVRAGGGRIVTSCASSLLMFRRLGARADDLSTWIATAAPAWQP